MKRNPVGWTGCIRKRREVFYCLLLVLLISPASFAFGNPNPIPIVVTIPVLKNLVQEVGGHRVAVQSLITGLEGEHTYTPKPSDILSLQKARLLVSVGLGLETWIAPLIKNADRPDLSHVVTSHQIPLMDDRNPHIWLDPEKVKTMTQNIAGGLIQIDPDGAKEYRAQEARFIAALDQFTQETIGKMEKIPPSRRKIVTHHAAWPYFANRFGLIIIGNIQTQIGMHSGSEPSAQQIRTLIQRIRQEKAAVLVSEPQLNQKIPDILVEETGIRRIVLSPLPGVFPKTDTYLDFMRYNIETLLRALQESKT